MRFERNGNGDSMFKNIINKAKAKGEEKRELRAIEKASYEDEKKKVKAANKQKKIAEAKARGKAKAQGKSGSTLKSVGARMDRAAKRWEEMNKQQKKGGKKQEPISLLKM